MRIAFCGESRSGKDTCADILINDSLFKFYRYAFGDYMKEAYYEDNPHKVYLPKDREHMISWSQPKVEKDNYIWVRMLEQEMLEGIEYYNEDHFVITDLRQPHEEKWCRDNGFHIVRVHSPLVTRENRAIDLGERLGVDLPYEVQADFHIYNDGSFEDLQKSLKNLLQVLEIVDKIKAVTEEANRIT